MHTLHSCAVGGRPLEAILSLLHICSQIQAMEVCWVWDGLGFLYQTFFKGKTEMAKSAFAKSWRWSVWNSSLSNSSFQLGRAHVCCFSVTNCLWIGAVKMLSLLIGKHHFTHVFTLSPYLDPHGLRSISPDVSMVPGEVLIYLGPFLYVWGVPVVGSVVLSTQIQQNGSAAHASTGEKKGGRQLWCRILLPKLPLLPLLSLLLPLKSIQIRISSGV